MRHALPTMLLLLVLISGCVSTGDPTPTPTATLTEQTSKTYVVFVSNVTNVSDEVTVVNYNDSRLEGAESVKRLVRESVGRDGTTERINASRGTALSAELDPIHRYDGDEFGYYIQYEGTTVRLYLAVEE